MSRAAAGNVQAGTISLIAAAVPGVDTVSNAAAIGGGLDGESDAALRSRFAAYLDSRARATPVAVGYAVSSVQQGLQYTIQENATQSGATQPGSFVVTVDDGTGAPPAALLDRRRHRDRGGAAARLDLDGGAAERDARGGRHDHRDRRRACRMPPWRRRLQAAVTAFVNALPVGATLPWSRLAQVAYGASASVDQRDRGDAERRHRGHRARRRRRGESRHGDGELT